MKNGHSRNGKTVIDAETQKPVQDVISAEHGRPVPKMVDFARSRNKQSKAQRKALAWYGQQPWDEWWDEFSTGIDDKGKPIYRTAWAFCKAKAKNDYERQLLWEMIGPDAPEEKTRRAPWLGDWQKRRANCFWAVDPDKFESIKAALKERQDAIESAKAIAPLTVPHMQRWHRLSNLIDEAFGGQPYLPDLPPTHPKNKARVREYIAVHKAAMQQEQKVWEAWMKAHGLNPADINSWLTMASMLAAKAGAAGAIAGMAIGASTQHGLSRNVTQFDLLLAQQIADQDQMYPGLDAIDVAKNQSTKKA